MKRKAQSRQRGFTIIEMIVVIMIILIVLTFAIPRYNETITRSKEAKLHHNLATLNNVIQQYSLDKKQAPLQLDDLVSAGYLREIPADITGSKDTWVTEQEDPEKAWNPDQLGIASVHSGSNETATDGTAYSGWMN
jgi:prepilin-type N-terminal cleavage/methylation domain-containing protein